MAGCKPQSKNSIPFIYDHFVSHLLSWTNDQKYGKILTAL